jgi:hypothetical protein
MDDEKKEEKIQEEQEPPKPWLLSHLERMVKAIDEGEKEITIHLEEIFEGITYPRLGFTDNRGKEYLEYLRRNNITTLEILKTKLMNGSAIYDARIIIDFMLTLLAERLDKPNKIELVLQLWKYWWGFRVNTDYMNYWKWEDHVEGVESSKVGLVDYLVLNFISMLQPSTLVKLDKLLIERGGEPILNVMFLGKNLYYHCIDYIEYIGRILENSHYDHLAKEGTNFRARAQALRVKEELKFDETKQELAQLKKDTEEQTEKLNKGIAEAKDNEQRMTRNFVQIIGIFAAIIAFVVTIVPMAVRLGGASSPIALAGLAIVTAEIIFILAMVFGNKQDKSKYQNWVIAGVFVFAVWLGFTAWLALKHPKTLVTAKEDSSLVQPSQRIEAKNLYMMNSTKDTVGTSKVSPPPPPSTREGE